jgi:hypothetical protein
MSIVKKASQIVVSLGRQEPTALLMLVWKKELGITEQTSGLNSRGQAIG